MSERKRMGFTIVELLIVIVVIAILATISIVAYRGVQERARGSAASTAVGQVIRKMALYSVDNDSYPNSLSALDITDTTSTTYQYVVNNSVTPKVWCAAATVGGKSYYASNSQKTPAEGACLNSGTGNVSPSFAYWVQSGSGATYDTGTGELVISKSAGGTYTSPALNVEDSVSVAISFQVYATTAAPNFTPKGGVRTGSYYFGADGVTPVQNTTGVTSNGNAKAADLNAWTAYSTSFQTGPNVKMIKLFISSDPGAYTGDGRIKDVSIVVNK